MSTQENLLPIDCRRCRGQPVLPHRQTHVWQRLTSVLETAGEWLNPILVKEVPAGPEEPAVRHHLHAGAVPELAVDDRRHRAYWPDVAFSANGPELFFGYYIILAFPLILIVPFSAFRSLIAEREDNTYELVAITTLAAAANCWRQVGQRRGANGRLFFGGRAVPGVHVSAARDRCADDLLHYVLHVPGVAWLLAVALLMATVAKEKHWQVMISVLIIVGLFYAFIAHAHLP